MIKFYLKLIFILLPISILSQVTSEQVLYDYQIAYCVGSSNSTAWIGEEVVIMIEGETASERDSTIMDTMVKTFENIISKYEELTGLNNLPIASSYDNKPVIEVVIDNCGAGGLASHGVLGMSTGKYFLDEYYDLVNQGINSVPQVFLYELNRNFWQAGMDGFNGKFDWAMNEEPQNYGWWTVGMNNAQAYIIPKSLNIGMYYFGNDLNYWETRMVGELEDYMNDSQYDFDFGWRQSLMPWHNTESINDLMSGLIIYSYNNFGGESWIKGFYEHIQNNDIPNRSGVFAYQECRDNIYKIWSYAANEDLISFFENDLRWIITPEAKSCVTDHVNTTSNAVNKSKTKTVLYPNPTSEMIVVKTELNKARVLQIYDVHGKLVKQNTLNKLRNSISLSDLANGIYLFKIEDEIFKIIKN